MVDDLFIARLAKRAADPSAATDSATDSANMVAAKVFSALSTQDLDGVERRLGFPLPPVVRAIYGRVGNGGFGPAYGLLGLDGGAVNEDRCDASMLYERNRQPNLERDPLWRWPAKLLPLVHLGCAMFLCVDCSLIEPTMTWFEPNPHEDGKPWDDAFFPMELTLAGLLERWLDGADLDDVFKSAWEAKFPNDMQ